MNFLAHFLLSFDEEPLILGNYLADFMKGDAWKSLPPDMQKGVQLHRFIDGFTDQHPHTRAGIARLRSTAFRYAPPVLDILSDFLLTRHWKAHEERPLPDFCQSMYRILLKNQESMPPAMRDRTRRMVEANWLQHYNSKTDLEFVMDRFSQRISAPFPIKPMLEAFFADLEWFDAAFNPFFAELRAETRGYLESLQAVPSI